MKLHIIYIIIGTTTLVLNLILTLHMIKKYNNENCQKNRDSEEVITFKLIGMENIGNKTTAAAPCDDTVSLQ